MPVPGNLVCLTPWALKDDSEGKGREGKGKEENAISETRPEASCMGNGMV